VHAPVNNRALCIHIHTQVPSLGFRDDDAHNKNQDDLNIENKEKKQSDSGKTRSTSSKKKRKAPAWVDEDDATIVVRISTVNRLRKLRRTESENTLTGVQYTQRLREMYGGSC